MNKLTIYSRFIAILLVFAIFVPLLVSAEDVGTALTESNQSLSKLSSDLAEELKNTDSSTKLSVNVFMADLDEEEVMILFSERHPDEYSVYMDAKASNISGSIMINGDLSLKDGAIISSAPQESQDLLQKAIEAKRAVYKEQYTVHNATILEKYISRNDCIFVSHYSPFAILNINKASILELAGKNNIISISMNESVGVYCEDLQLANEITRAGYVRDTYGNRGSGVKIGQIEPAVPDVSDPQLTSANIIIQSPNPSSMAQEKINHATQVARILVGTDTTGGYDGYAPSASLYSCSVSSNLPFYSGIEWLLDQGVNVINMSAALIGSSIIDGAYTTYDQWVDHIAVQHDVHFVKSAGNNAGNVTTPGMAYNAITVGGLDGCSSTSVSNFALFENTSYIEIDQSRRAEKPNLVASATNFWENSGTSYAAPQVAGTIAQLCSYAPALKVKQSAIGAILAASSAKKVDAIGNGEKGDSFISSVRVSTLNAQISDKEGAGILDSRWARGIVSYGNYWSHTINAENFPYEKKVTINATSNSLTRIAIFWLKRNTVDHTTNSVQQNAIADLDLYIYDPNGDLVGSSSLYYTNFEIVQFIPEISGTYTIRIQAPSCSDKAHVGIAVW